MSNIETVKRCCDVVAAFHAGYIELRDQKARDELKLRHADIVASIRFNRVTTAASLETLWTRIQGNEDMLDYVLRGTSRMRLLGAADEAEWQAMLDHMVESLAWCSIDPNMHKTIRDRAVTTTWLSTTFKQSPWYVFLYIGQLVLGT
jgi:hypothetical protein